MSEGQCLLGYYALTGTGLTTLISTRRSCGQPGSADCMFREVAAAGCTTSWVSCIFNFTDVAKVRMQAASAQGLAGGFAQYGSFRSTVAEIMKHEGLRGLVLPGIVASCLRDLSYSGLSIGMYPSLKNYVFVQTTQDETSACGDIGFMRKFAVGMFSGALFSGFVNPADFLKIRVQAEAGRVGESGLLVTGLRAGSPPNYANSLHAFAVVRKREGFAALYRGCTATMIRAACGRGAQLSCYDHAKYLLKTHGGMHEGVLLHMMGSFLSGLAFATASAPSDIIKTRLMADTSNQYRGFLDCLVCLVRTGGFFAVFRGWTPSAARLAPHFTIVGVTMEQVRVLVGVGYFAT